MPIVNEQFLEQLRQLRETGRGASLENRRRINDATALLKANRTLAHRLERTDPEQAQEIVGDTEHPVLNAIGTVGHALDTPGRELVRKPAFRLGESLGLLPEGTVAGMSKDATTAEMLRAVGFDDNIVTSILGFAGDMMTDPLMIIGAPGLFTKLASRTGQVGGQLLTKAGRAARAARAVELQKLGHATNWSEAVAKASEEMLEKATAGTLERGLMRKAGQPTLSIPFTNIEQPLSIPTFLKESGVGQATASAMTAMKQSTIGQAIGRGLDHGFQILDKKFRIPVHDFESQAVQLAREQTIAMARKDVEDAISMSVSDWWDTGWFQGAKNRRNAGAIRDAMENLRGLEDDAFSYLPSSVRRLNSLSEAGADPQQVARFYDEMLSTPTGKHAEVFKRGLEGSDVPFEQAVQTAKTWQVLTSEMWQRVTDTLGKDAAGGFWEAYVPLVFKVGSLRRHAFPHRAASVESILQAPFRGERQFNSFQDAYRFVQDVASERGLAAADVNRVLEVVDDPVRVLQAHLIAGETAIATEQMKRAFINLAQRKIVMGKGAYTGMAFKTAARADLDANPMEGLVEITQDVREKYLGGHGGEIPNPALLTAKTRDQSNAIAQRLLEEGESLSTKKGDYISRVVTPPGTDQITLGGKDYLGPVKQVQALRDLAPFDESGKFRSEVGGWFRSMTNNFKRGVTQGFLSFHVRNAYSDLVRQLEDDLVATLNPVRQVQAMMIRHGSAGTFVTPAGQQFSFDDLRNIFRQQLEGFHVQRGDYTQSFLNLMRQRHGGIRHIAAQYMGGMEKFGVHVENHSKMIGLLNNLDKGLSIEEAAARTFRTHFNYSWITRADKNIKQAVPFYIWQKKAFQHIVTQLFEAPGTQSALLRGMNYLETELPRGLDLPLLNEQQRGALPDFLQEGPVIPVWADSIGSGEIGLASGLDITQGELSKLALFNAPSWPALRRQLGQLASILSPAVKLPAELLAGEDFFYGTPIDDISRTTAEGRKRFPYIPKDAPLGIEWLRDPVNQKFAEAAGFLASAIPGLSFTAALGRLISEKRRIGAVVEGIESGEPDKITGSLANFLAGFQVRPYNLEDLTVRQTIGDIHATNERLRQAVFNARRTAGQ